MKEILRLTQENNKMLHAMRRGTLMRTVFKMVFYAVLVVSFLYFYMTYVAPVLQEMLTTVQQIQGTGAQAQAQFGSFQDMLKSFAEKFKPGTSTQ